MTNLLENLNEEQLAAVLHKDGPFLIVAGAGTGKTTVIARRLAYLIEQGLAQTDEILALTFTEKAAAEMTDRVESLLPLGYFDLWISTFHGLAERLLKEHGLSIGLPGDFKLLNEFEQWALVKKNLDKFELDYYRPLGNPTKFIRALLKHFSRAKDEDISPRQYLEYADGLKQDLDGMLSGASKLSLRGASSNLEATKQSHEHGRKREIARPNDTRQNDFVGLAVGQASLALAMTDEQEVLRLNEIANAYQVYQQLLLDNNALDFGDLINYALKLFRERPAILEKYRKQFKHILVDEFQDTNWAQYELVKLLAAPVNNLTVVGDDDQAIYRFRGASMSNILQFKKDFPESREIILTKNYRSAQNILDLAYEFIKQNNPNRLEWQLQDQNLSVIASDRRERSLPDCQPDKVVLAGVVRAGNLTYSELNQRLPRRPEYGSPRNDKGEVNILSKKLVAENNGQGIIEVIQGADLADEIKQDAIASLQHDKSKKLSKKLIAETAGSGLIEVIQGVDLAEEVKLAADKIIELKNNDKNSTWNDFAVLVRANDSANNFMAEFERRGLPYIFGASRGLYAKPIIMDAAAYFKLLDNYHESLALWRILNLPIFNFTYEELVNFNHLAGKKAWSLYEVIKGGQILKFAGGLEKKIKPVLALIAKHSVLAREKPASEVFLAFMNDSGYLKYLAGLGDRRNIEAINLLNQFLKRIKAFENYSDDKTVKAFLAELNLEIEAGAEGDLTPETDVGPEAIKILTAHGAKGLEFAYVFMVNLVDKRFPTIERGEPISLPEALIKEILPGGDAHLEEERRLFYVAMTRAKAGLYFSWATDYGGKTEKKPSRFLIELGMAEKKNNKIKLNEFPARNQELGIRKHRAEKKPLIPNSLFLLPAHFSYSQLAAYSNCPYQYRFAHILKIPIRGKEQFSFGKTLHLTLQKLFVLINEKKDLGQGDLFSVTKKSPLPPFIKGGISGKSPLPPFPPERLPARQGHSGGVSSSRAGVKGGNITFDEVLKLYEQSWVDDWFASKQKKQERKRQGQEILKVFYEKHKANWPEVLFLEKGFNFRIKDGEAVYVVRGAVDRIDQALAADSGQTGGLKLVDYKTGQPKDKLSFADKEQLLIYQLAIQELCKQEVKILAFYYLDNNSEVEFIGSAKDLEKITAKIIKTIKEIKQGRFEARPGVICAWCDFKEICEYRA